MIDLLIVCLERCRINLRIVIPINIVQGWSPVYGEVIRIFSGRTALLELGSCWEVFRDGVGTVEGVHVGDVFSRENNGVNVFSHERFVFDVGKGSGRAS